MSTKSFTLIKEKFKNKKRVYICNILLLSRVHSLRYYMVLKYADFILYKGWEPHPYKSMF